MVFTAAISTARTGDASKIARIFTAGPYPKAAPSGAADGRVRRATEEPSGYALQTRLVGATLTSVLYSCSDAGGPVLGSGPCVDVCSSSPSRDLVDVLRVAFADR